MAAEVFAAKHFTTAYKNLIRMPKRFCKIFLTRTVYSNGGHSIRNLVILRTMFLSLKMKSDVGPDFLSSFPERARRGIELVLPSSPVGPTGPLGQFRLVVAAETPGDKVMKLFSLSLRLCSRIHNNIFYVIMIID